MVKNIVGSELGLLKFVKLDNFFLLLSMRCNFSSSFYLTHRNKLNALGESRFKYVKYLYASKNLARRDYTHNTEKAFLDSVKASREIVSNFRYLDFIIQKYGYKNKRIKLPLERFVNLRLFDYMTKNQKARLAVILFENDMPLEAQMLVKTIGKAFISNKACYLSLAFHANKIFKHKDSNLVLSTRMYSHIQKTSSSFSDFIRKNKGNLCIVGNAPNELGKGKGKDIDAHKVVIRFNNYSTLNSEDYGEKETVWVRVANNEIEKKHSKKNKYTIFAGNNFDLKRKDALQYTLEPYLSRKQYTVIPSEIYQELIKKLGCLPSTGMAFLYWIYKICGPLSKDQLYGFTYFSNEGSYKDHYFQNTTEIAEHIHPWEKEEALVKKLVVL